MPGATGWRRLRQLVPESSTPLPHLSLRTHRSKRVSRCPRLSGTRHALPKPDQEHDVDFLARPRARQALVILRQAEQDGSPDLPAGVFEERIVLTTRHAIKLRGYLLHWDLITAEDVTEGKKLFTRIRLTSKGRKVADMLLQTRKEVHGENTKLRQPPREKY